MCEGGRGVVGEKKSTLSLHPPLPHSHIGKGRQRSAEKVGRGRVVCGVLLCAHA
jgi:hypothetical protein